MTLDKALAPLLATCAAYSEDSRVQASGAAYPGDALGVVAILWDGDGQGREARLALVEALEDAALNAGAALKAGRVSLSVDFQSEARDPDTWDRHLLALSVIFPDDVRANPAAALAALVDPVEWRGVLEAA